MLCCTRICHLCLGNDIMFLMHVRKFQITCIHVHIPYVHTKTSLSLTSNPCMAMGLRTLHLLLLCAATVLWSSAKCKDIENLVEGLLGKQAHKTNGNQPGTES